MNRSDEAPVRGGFEFDIDVPAHAPGEPTEVGALVGPEVAPLVEHIDPPRFEPVEEPEAA